MKKYLWILGVLFIAALGYAATPLLSLNQLRAAVVKNDEQALDKLVDFHRLRASLKDQSRAVIRDRLQHTEDLASVNAFRTEIAALFVDQLLENIVSPDGFARLLRSGKFSASQQRTTQSSSGKPLSLPAAYRLGYASWQRFHVSMRAAQDRKILLRMERNGIFGWRVVDVLLPKEDA